MFSLSFYSDVVFEISQGNIQGYRANLESLCPLSYVDAIVLDIWAFILSYEEKLRRPTSVRRLFIPCTYIVSC